jgi:hypothetical protein
LRRNRSDFMLETACREAEAVLLDRRYFSLSAEDFKRFTVDARPSPSRQPPVAASAANRGAVGAMSRQSLTPPEKLRDDHDLSLFECGEPALDDWLRRRALPNEESGASRTYVVCLGLRVVAYYALAVGAVAHAGAPGRVRRNMPDPVPVMIIGRLAVDQRIPRPRPGPGACARRCVAHGCRRPTLPASGPSWSTPSPATPSASTRGMASCVRRSIR